MKPRTSLLPIATLCLSMVLLACQGPVTVHEEDHRILLENSSLRFEFDQELRSWGVFDQGAQSLVLTHARLQIGQFSLSDASYEVEWDHRNVKNEFGKGRQVILTGRSEVLPDIGFSFTLYDLHPFLDIAGRVINDTGDTLQIHDIYGMKDAHLYPESDLSDDFAMVDGFSGGEPLEYGHRIYSPLSRRNALKSRNNILLTFRDDGRRHTLVMGGLNYQDFEKFAWIEQPRPVELECGSDGRPSLLSYLNLPVDTLDETTGKARLKLIRGHQLRKWQYHEFHCTESATTASDPERIVVELDNLKSEMNYYLGFSRWRNLWHGDRKDHHQSVYIELDLPEGMKRIPLFENQMIPRFDGKKKEQIAQVEILLPREAVVAGKARFVVEHGGNQPRVDPNVYLSEIWLRDAAYESLFPDRFVSVDSVDLPRKHYKGQLFANDPVGKRVLPGSTYESPDRFYVGVAHPDPFFALENYSLAVSRAQEIRLPMYDFPTVCLWYAENSYYGGSMAENTSVGAVREMDHIKSSGFLNYSRAAVRLVPDSYMPDNQQGWWDDEHWQLPVEPHNGSKNGRYLEPYETSEKWGKAVVERGGIPLTYFQTAYRSEDYAKAYPEHMLFNKTYAWKGEPQDTTGPIFTDWNQTWTRNGRTVWGYDYSDPGFIAHLEEVYANLKKGHIQGLMFDYPASGWARQGGLENPDWTTANAYRNIFRLPFEGLGPDAWVHERNMERGTDVSIGVIASMRTENDTDLMDAVTVTRCGLRWYKNRVLYNQDTDSKNLVRLEGKPDLVRSVLTMAYVTTGRLLLANSFSQMSAQTIHDLTRTFPYHTDNQSARPVDAFVSDIPRVYDFRVNDEWHQVTFYNPDFDHYSTVGIMLSGQAVDGALELLPSESYHVYDFWNDQFVGTFNGGSRLEQTLRPGEARMLSVRKVVSHPQVISTNRHLMQGYLDMDEVRWNKKSRTLSGTSLTVAGDPYLFVVAMNGFSPENLILQAGQAKIEVISNKDDLLHIQIISLDTESTPWKITF